jgi:hypothetical protein
VGFWLAASFGKYEHLTREPSCTFLSAALHSPAEVDLRLETVAVGVVKVDNTNGENDYRSGETGNKGW